MKIPKLSSWVQGSVTVSAAAVLVLAATTHRAHAFGGFWSSGDAPIQQAGAQMLFVDNPDSTVTAVIQIKYDGPAQEFAWVIPVPGTPTVAISSSIVFQRLEAATAPEYWVEVAVEGMCMAQDEPVAALDAGSGTDGAPSSPDTMGEQVEVIDQGSAGAYDYVNLTVDPSVDDPAEVAREWLTTNGYALTGLESEVLSPYLSDGLNLLAFKLGNGADVGAIRPVILTYESELPVIPIRPAAVAAQDDMGIQVWVIGPSQAVPGNYKSLVINEALIDWLTAETYAAGTLPAGGVGPFGARVRRPGNYDAVVSAAADEAGGRGFVTELGGPASQYRDKVWAPLDDETFARISSQSYADGIDAILAAKSEYGGWDGWKDTIESATTLPDGVTIDEFATDPEQYRGVAELDTARFLELLDEKVIRPVADTAALLYRAPYLTRLYATMSADEMTVDPVFDYNADLAQVSNVHVAKQFFRCKPSLNQDAAPWRIELSQGGVVVGEGGGGWPIATGSLPANLKVVMLSTHGSGTVVEDNSEEIGVKLLEIAGTTGNGAAAPRSPQHGVLIGGTQTVTPYEPAGSTHDGPRAMTRGRARTPAGSHCSVTHAGAGSATALALWLPLAGLIFARRRRRRHGVSVWALLLLAACSGGEERDDAPTQADAGAPLPTGGLTLEQLRDPETCKGCHPIHYRAWSSSMHAYAARDPVFLAMNERGQRETDGELGDFCIKCHAPMAVVDGLTRDGLDLGQLPDKQRGVSCYFCHNVIGVEGDHNAMLRLANDTTMRGPISDPLHTSAHGAESSALFDGADPSSSAMCGACHDIVTPAGVHLERTFEEYRNGLFSKSATGEPPAFDSCVGCHMPGRDGLAAVVPGGAPVRRVTEHLWPGIDVALTDFPHRDAMRSAVEDCQLGLGVAFFTLEVTPPDLFTFQIETGAGHNTPSGAAHDRRMWLEFLAYDESDALLEQVSSGDIADDEIEERPADDPKHDPHLAMFGDHIYDAQGKPVHMFWEAAKSSAHPEGFESTALPVATTTYVEGKHAVVKQYRASGPMGLPARVIARLRMRPMGLDVLQDLVDSGDLDPAIVEQMPTFTFGAQIEWTPEKGVLETVAADPKPADCITYRCLLDPSSLDCR